MKSFKRNEKIFQLIRKEIEDKKNENKIEEYVELVKKLYLKYDPRINENKFIIGHAMEILFCILLNSLKIDAKWLGSNKNGCDLVINGDEFSIKTVSNPHTNLRIINIHGKSSNADDFQFATILIELGMGIKYFSPTDLKKFDIKLKEQRDGYDLYWRDLYKIIENTKNFISIDNLKSKKEFIKEQSSICSASEDVILNILTKHSSILKKYSKKYKKT